jgi:hypothetical protein
MNGTGKIRQFIPKAARLLAPGRPLSARVNDRFHFTNRQRPLFSAMRLILVHGSRHPLACHFD